MSIFQKWAFDIFVKKTVKRGVLILVAWLTSEQVRAIGVQVDEAALTAAIWTGLEALRQLVKTNTGWSWI